MVRRTNASAAAAQLQLTARPTRQKWSADAICSPMTRHVPAPAAWSAQQVGSSRWSREGGEAEVGADLGLGGSAGRPGRVTLTNPPI